MIPSKRRLLKELLKLFDLSALVASFVVAGVVAYSSPEGLTFARVMGVRITLGNCLLFALLLLTWHKTFMFCGLYISKRLTKRRAEILEVSKATSLASGLLFVSARAFHIGIVDGDFLVLFWVCCTCSMVVGRLAACSFLLSLRRRGRNSRFVLIVGTNDRAIDFANQITGRPELGYEIVGFVDDDWEGTEKFQATGYTRCCAFPGLADFLRQNVVDEAAIFLPLRSYYEHAAQLVSLCELHGIVIRFNSQVFNLRNTVAQEQHLDENSLVLAVASSTEAWPSLVKRVVDFVVSVLLLIVLAPLFCFVALLVKLTSPGPVLFSQTRVGLNKRQFRMYKFRTMITEAEQMQDALLSRNEMSGAAFKIKQDPRITSIGRVLRKTSVDELPQLFNVLCGEMSLVGPRAMSLRDYRLFDKDWQRRRFSVKPGITCLWQVNGRSSLAFDKWMELDMQYIDKWSLWLDFKILAQTLPAVVRGTGAA
jgi:exopolysaccharide biosynthesis polyprenyl glycosylphosphotransferase